MPLSQSNRLLALGELLAELEEGDSSFNGLPFSLYSRKLHKKPDCERDADNKSQEKADALYDFDVLGARVPDQEMADEEGD